MLDVPNLFFLYDSFALMADSGRNELVSVAELIK